MTKKQKKELEKRQAAAKKQQAQNAKTAKASAAKRQQEFAKAAKRQASARQGMGGVRPRRTSDGKGPLGFVLSVKGVALLGGVGYMWVAQRQLLLKLSGIALKYPLLIASMVFRKGWDLLLKPLLRKLIALKGGSGGAAAMAAAGELPGGSY